MMTLKHCLLLSLIIFTCLCITEPLRNNTIVKASHVRPGLRLSWGSIALNHLYQVAQYKIRPAGLQLHYGKFKPQLGKLLTVSKPESSLPWQDKVAVFWLFHVLSCNLIWLILYQGTTSCPVQLETMVWLNQMFCRPLENSLLASKTRCFGLRFSLIC